MSAEVAVPVVLRRAQGPQSGTRHLTDQEMPLSGPLVDRYGRAHTDLRISVTDRCNLRCLYCLPEEGVPFRPREEILTFEEIARVAEVARRLGVTALRLTGGEPLLRRRLVELVRSLAALGFEDLALTTNGTGLGPQAVTLAAAGLQRVNISCDSLRADRFATIRRRGHLATVLAAMDAAEAAGLRPVKVNVVLMAGVNEDEVLDFANFARERGRPVRFIEYMPLDAEGRWRRDQVVPSEKVLELIHARWPIEAVFAGPGAAPAERYRFRDGRGEIGIVASVTRPFCASCNRLRLTADGAVRNCLFSDDETSLRDLMRSGGSDDDLVLALRTSVWEKLPGHGINDPGFLRPARSMSMIGG